MFTRTLCQTYFVLLALVAVPGAATAQGAPGEVASAYLASFEASTRASSNQAAAPDFTIAPPQQAATRDFWPSIGGLYALGTFAAVGYAVSLKRTLTVCGGPVVDDHCASEHVIARTSERPRMTSGLVAAGIIAAAGVVHLSYHRRAFEANESRMAAADISLGAGVMNPMWDGDSLSVDFLHVSF